MLGEIWKIGDWSVFPAENTLRRDGSEVKVPPRLMDALIFFARHPDHVISRTELVAHLWNRSVVTDQTRHAEHFRTPQSASRWTRPARGAGIHRDSAEARLSARR